MVISAGGVGFAFGDPTVLHGVDFDAPQGQVLGLVGPNGSGKTTLLRTLYASLKA
ncbi:MULTISPECIES: ABC transporter ATP-binding protein [unclassified Arthrobacter]|uniref:ATP-binding cassette domain-containing protein n=1 Tax=unclassified Arthrobacter TaxID=235627 RepID=UPI002157C692|nr:MULTISPECIES: ABC transporter ATP-binding protein [unclassified Arthrobacter]